MNKQNLASYTTPQQPGMGFSILDRSSGPWQAWPDGHRALTLTEGQKHSGQARWHATALEDVR